MDLSFLRKRTADAGAHIRELRTTKVKLAQAIEQLKQEREWLEGLLPNAKDRADYLVAVLRAQQSKSGFLKRFQQQTQGLMSKPLRDPERFNTNVLGLNQSGAMTMDAMLFYFRDEIEAGVRRAAAEAPYEGESDETTLEERKARVAEIDQEIAELEEQEAELDQSLKALGVETAQ